MNVLVVEDDPISLKLVHVVLEQEGFQVARVGHAEGALRMVKEKKPEIILLDLSLPGLDGLSLTRLLKNESDTKEIPVVAITSFPDRFPREDVLNSGCDSYIIKPIDTRTLAMIVSRIGNGTNPPHGEPRVD